MYVFVCVLFPCVCVYVSVKKYSVSKQILTNIVLCQITKMKIILKGSSLLHNIKPGQYHQHNQSQTTTTKKIFNISSQISLLSHSRIVPLFGLRQYTSRFSVFRCQFSPDRSSTSSLLSQWHRLRPG